MMTTSPQPFTPHERRKRERSVWRTGLLLSALIHALVFLVAGQAPIPLETRSAAGPSQGDPRAATGAMRALNVRAAPVTPVQPPPVPIAVEVTVEVVEFEDEPQVDPAELLGDMPGLADLPGIEDGAGGGDQGDQESGADGLRPPSPRGLIIPPTNRDLRGTEVRVWVFVDREGRVVPDSTRLEPPTQDGSFNRRLMTEAAEWVFRPATRAGEAISAWFPYRIIM